MNLPYHPGGLWARLSAEWKLKAFLGGAVMAVFWIGYFLIERLPNASVTQMPESAIDRMIPFLPGAAWLYASQYVTVPLVVWLMTTRRQLMSCCRGAALLIGASFVVFYLWPTGIARPEIKHGHNLIYNWIVAADLPRNACPSLHAGFGVFIACCGGDVFRGWRNSGWLVGLLWLLTAAVLFSTLLIKQHVVLDLAAGGALGALSWWLQAPRVDKAPCRE